MTIVQPLCITLALLSQSPCRWETRSTPSRSSPGARISSPPLHENHVKQRRSTCLAAAYASAIPRRSCAALVLVYVFSLLCWLLSLAAGLLPLLYTGCNIVWHLHPCCVGLPATLCLHTKCKAHPGMGLFYPATLHVTAVLIECWHRHAFWYLSGFVIPINMQKCAATCSPKAD